MKLSHSFLWRIFREQKILATHARVARICQELLDRYQANPVDYDIKPKKEIRCDRIIWQYWAQGFENVPSVVRECLASVEQWKGDYIVIRLSDENLAEYLDLPVFVQEKQHLFSRAHFADLLRLLLLKAYGGIWMDATVYLSGPIPEEYVNCGFFVFQRDPHEPDYKYWRDTYAYYFGWAKGFRVNMLNSFIVADKGNHTLDDLCNLMLLWWETNHSVPDYFFFQILCDVYGLPESIPLVSDTLPHYLQQSINDPRFSILKREDILKRIPIHKLTYK